MVPALSAELPRHRRAAAGTRPGGRPQRREPLGAGLRAPDRVPFNILATFAEFEADLIRLRTREGLAIAKARGRLRGQQPSSPKGSRRNSAGRTTPAHTRSAIWPSGSLCHGRLFTARWSATNPPVAREEAYHLPLKVTALRSFCEAPLFPQGTVYRNVEACRTRSPNRVVSRHTRFRIERPVHPA